MQFIFTEPQTECERIFGGFYHINSYGRINTGDDRVFAAYLDATNPPARTTVFINSEGGDVDAAIEIGRLIRARWLSTSIGQCLLEFSDPSTPIMQREFLPGSCISAATLIYLGGRLRFFPDGSKFGVHQFSFKDPTTGDSTRSQVLSAKIAHFIVDMGVNPEFLTVTSATPSNQIEWVEASRLRELGVVSGDQSKVEWSVHARNGTLYVRGERDSIYGHHKVMLAYSREMNFYFWAVIESQGREEELVGFNLVEIVIDGENTRIDVSERCNRSILGSYVNIIAKLTIDEARKIAVSESFGVHVRFSEEADMFFGISAMSTDGGREELKTLFNTISDK